MKKNIFLIILIISLSVGYFLNNSISEKFAHRINDLGVSELPDSAYSSTEKGYPLTYYRSVSGFVASAGVSEYPINYYLNVLFWSSICFLPMFFVVFLLLRKNKKS